MGEEFVQYFTFLGEKVSVLKFNSSETIRIYFLWKFVISCFNFLSKKDLLFVLRTNQNKKFSSSAECFFA
jgi:uncharacterized protein with PQ loop repeat